MTANIGHDNVIRQEIGLAKLESLAGEIVVDKRR